MNTDNKTFLISSIIGNKTEYQTLIDSLDYKNTVINDIDVNQLKQSITHFLQNVTSKKKGHFPIYLMPSKTKLEIGLLFDSKENFGEYQIITIEKIKYLLERPVIISVNAKVLLNILKKVKANNISINLTDNKLFFISEEKIFIIALLEANWLKQKNQMVDDYLLNFD